MATTTKFEYFAGEQRSPEWFKLRLGRVTASRLVDWLAVSKAAKTLNQPLKPRLDYEKELQFERQFGISYESYVTPAMQDGIDFEDFARKQYEKIVSTTVRECGAWYSDNFVASPDGIIPGVKDMEPGGPATFGILEIKVLKDTSFTEVLASGVPDKHFKQIQGQLWASGAKYCDYAVINLNTRKIKIIRVERDEEFIEWIELTLTEKFVAQELDATNVYDFVDEIPKELEATVKQELDFTRGW